MSAWSRCSSTGFRPFAKVRCNWMATSPGHGMRIRRQADDWRIA
jgi:hypothetical protein